MTKKVTSPLSFSYISNIQISVTFVRFVVKSEKMGFATFNPSYSVNFSNTPALQHSNLAVTLCLCDRMSKLKSRG
jgi:hypothetical protein